ncbi:hypothetical protein PhaeoP88_04706 (plasmid) [Phaeobacter inhibens]|uniref:Uncharacterized protein n=1 Tax=Phaeobacter inhibens TaxID=221822 RepID=A0A2I7KHE5_9RHOB|nr:hypothetical protein PhaeoP88_04706 [Phaeobacter inhibens]
MMLITITAWLLGIIVAGAVFLLWAYWFLKGAFDHF